MVPSAFYNSEPTLLLFQRRLYGNRQTYFNVSCFDTLGGQHRAATTDHQCCATSTVSAHPGDEGFEVVEGSVAGAKPKIVLRRELLSAHIVTLVSFACRLLRSCPFSALRRLHAIHFMAVMNPPRRSCRGQLLRLRFFPFWISRVCEKSQKRENRQKPRRRYENRN